jgi:hypothetical protein
MMGCLIETEVGILGVEVAISRHDSFRRQLIRLIEIVFSRILKKDIEAIFYWQKRMADSAVLEERKNTPRN